MTNDFIPLIGKKVRRLFLVVWPPFCETQMLDVDISIALEVDEIEGVFHLKIDQADGWTPIVSKANFDEFRQWREFQQRINDWMDGQIDSPFEHEVFDATHATVFENIVSREILDIECVTLNSEFGPFGVKLIFSNDYIIVSPISDGTTVETAMFNKLGNLEIHKALGEIEFISMVNQKP